MPRQSFAQRYLDAWNCHSAREVSDYFVDEATYIDSALQVHAQGRRVAQHIEHVLSLCPDARFELMDEPIASGGRMAIPWVLKSRYAHRLTLDSIGTASAEGISGIDYITYHRDKILSTRVYIDLSPYIELTANRLAPADMSSRHSGLTEEGMKHYQQQLLKLLDQERIYLRDDLTLTQLAAELDISVNYLSQVINRQFQVNFSELLNRYRVQHAKGIMDQQGGTPSLSVLEIAFASGFGASSTFYAAFKKHLQQSPAQYLKQCRTRH